MRTLLLDVAIRVSELCNLTWGALSQEHGHWFLSTRVKGDHHVSLPLSPEVAIELERWFDACLRPNALKPILLDAHGKKLKRGQLSYLTQKIARQAGIQRFVVTPHILRHTLNVVRRQANIDPTMRSALLAHSSPTSLISYEHTDPRELIAARAQQRRGMSDYLKNTRSLWQLPEGGPTKS
jgi:integrase